MPFENIDFLIEESGIARITLDRPDQRNAMTPAMGEEVRAAVEQINASETARVAIIRGAGRAFCSGADLANLAHEAGNESESEGLGGEGNFYRLFLSIGELRVPSIAAINGHAIGAGLCFALGADLRVMHTKAKVGMTFVRLGIHPGMGGTWNLPRLVGQPKAAELLYTGRLVEAGEALSIGLVNAIAGDDFDDTVEALATSIRDNAPIAVAAVKATLREGERRTLEESLEVESAAQAMTFRTDDAAEGIAAIREKRRASFQGR